MQIISSYGVELRKQNIPIRQTLEIYRSAVSYLIGIYVQVWEELAEIPDAKRRFNAAEHLVHTTKKNHACFDFDIRFPKMPSYLRRSAIQHALGTVSSYKTRLDLWEKTDGKSGKPKLVYENHAMPVFYRDVMYREGAEGKDEAYLKLYDGHDWKWFCVRLEHTDMEYLRKHWSGKKVSAPTLEKRHRKYFLRFSYTEEVTLTKTPVKEQIICSVVFHEKGEKHPYLTEDEHLEVGDKVLVQAGPYKQELPGKIVSIDYYRKEDLPEEMGDIGEILKKIEE
mgnify:CR=1 FL=1